MSLSGGTATPGSSSSYREELQTMLNNSSTNDNTNFYSVLINNANNEKKPDYDTNEIKMKLNYYMADKKVFKDHKYYKRRTDNNRPFLLTINDIFTSPMNLKSTKALISLSKISKEHPFSVNAYEFPPSVSGTSEHVTRSTPLDLSKNGTDDDDDNDNDSNTSFEHDSTSFRETSQVTSNANNSSSLDSSSMSILEPKIEITYESDSLPNETVV